MHQADSNKRVAGGHSDEKNIATFFYGLALITI